MQLIQLVWPSLGVFQDPRPSLYATSPQGTQSAFADSEVNSKNSSSEENFGFFRDKLLPSESIVYGSSRISSISISECVESHLDPRPGWPLLRRVAPEAVGRRDMSVVQWVMRLPDRSQCISTTPRNMSSNPTFGRIHGGYASAEDQIMKEMELLLSRKLSSFVWFDFKVLCRSTSQFSSGSNISTF